MSSTAGRSSGAGAATDSGERRLAILIGIDEYQSGIQPLRNAVRDVDAIGQVLRGDHGYTVRWVRNQEATLAGLRALLATLAAEITPTDRVILYFAGHGLADEVGEHDDGPQGFLIPQDARRDDPGTFLPMLEVQKALQQLACAHLLLFLDCCFAGAFRWSRTRDLRVQRKTLYRERFERYRRDPAWQVITSAAHDEQAADWLGGRGLGSRGGVEASNSPFAAALCQGLRGEADLRVGGQRGDGIVVASELHLYLESAFERLEVQLGRPLQKPMLWSLANRDKGQFYFYMPGVQPVLPIAAELCEENNPYRGLQPYGEDTSDKTPFFGRAAATEALLAQVQRQSLVVVVGASGTGKSSLVRAGLIPRLHKSEAPRFRILKPQRPGNGPAAMLSALAAELRPGCTSLPDAVAAWSREEPDEHLVICIDQLEEVITQGDQAALLLQVTGETRRAGGDRIHLVMTLRSDFEPHFRELLQPDAAGSPRFLIPPMSRAELREVIEGPASERVLYFEPPALVDRLLDEVADMPGALPLLSFTLSEMYRASLRRPQDRTLSEADYLALGGVAGALSQRADAVFAGCADEADRDAFRHLMLRLVVPGEAARRRVPESELEFAEPTRSKVHAIKDRLLKERLLVSDLDGSGRRFIEPAHDKLVMGWPLLGRFLATDKWHLLHHSLIRAAQGWAEGGRPRGELWDGNPRRELVAEMQRREPQRCSLVEGEFMRRSQRWRQGKLAGLVATAVLVAVGLFAWGYRERLNRNRIAQQKDAIEKQSAEITRQNGVLAEDVRAIQRQKSQIEEQARDIRQRLIDGYTEQGRQLLVAGQPQKALAWLNRAYQEGGQGEVLRFLLAQAVRPSDSVLASEQVQGFLVVSPDLRRLAVVRNAPSMRKDGETVIEILDPESGQRRFSAGSAISWASSVVFSPDARLLAISADEGAPGRYAHTVRIWDAQSGAVRCTALDSKDSSDARSLYFSLDGKLLAGPDAAGALLIWDAGSCQRRASLALGLESSTLNDLRFSPDSLNVLAYYNGEASVWDLRTGARRFTLSRDVVERFARYSPDGARIVTTRDKTAYLWDARTGAALGKLGARERLMIASFSPSGERLALIDEEGGVELWDAARLKRQQVLHAHRSLVSDFTWSPDGRRLITGSSDHLVKVWDVRSGALLKTLERHSDVITSVAISLDGQRVFIVGDDDTYSLWNLQSGMLRATLTGHEGAVSAIDRTDDGRYLLTVGRETRFLDLGLMPLYSLTLHVWDAASGQLLYTLKKEKDRDIRDYDFDPARRRLVTLHPDEIKLWELGASARLLRTIPRGPRALQRIDLSPDGDWLLLTPEGSDAELVDLRDGAGEGPRRILRDLRDRGDRGALAGKPRELVGADFTPDGSRVVTSSLDGTMQLWDARTGALVATMAGQPFAFMDMSPDGRYLATVNADPTEHLPLVLWDLRAGKQLRTVPAQGMRFRSLRFSPDGESLITATEDYTAKVWDTATLRLVRVLEGHKQLVSRVAFTRNGELLITGSEDGAIKIWAAHTGRLLWELDGHAGEILDLGTSADGRLLLTTGGDKTARVWDLQLESRTPQELAARLRCRLLHRIEGEALVPAAPEPGACAAQAAPN